MFLRVAPPPAWARASRTRPIVAAAGRLRTSLAPAQGASVAERQRCVGRGPSGLAIGVPRRVRLSQLLIVVARTLLLSLKDAAGSVSSLARRLDHPLSVVLLGRRSTPTHPPSNEARLPAELKHITKRRRRN